MTNKRVLAVCPGSFDPVTVGHTDIITRASGLYDHVVALVLTNPGKTPVFSVAQRMDFLRRSLAHLHNLDVDCYTGLLADYVKSKGASVIVKGLRAMSDFEVEFQQALINKKLYGGAETCFLVTDSANTYLSSSAVRTVAGMGGDISAFVPGAILREIESHYQSERMTKQ